METKAEYKISNVCTDELTELILDVQDAGEEIAGAYEWGTDPEQRREKAATARAALREYVDALVKGGITAQISDLLEQVAALEIVIDAKEQTIAAMQARIDALQAENEHISDELRIYTESAENEHIAHVYFEKEYLVAGRENVVLRMRIEELESEIRELQE